MPTAKSAAPSTLLGSAASAPSTTDGCEALLGTVDEFARYMTSLQDPKKVAFSYLAPAPYTVWNDARELWRKRLGVEFTAQPKFLAHFSRSELLIDAMLGLTRPGDRIEIQSNDASIHSVQKMRRVFGGKKPAALVWLDEEVLLQDSRGAKAALDAILADRSRVSDDAITIVARTWRPDMPPSLLTNAHPSLIEVVDFSAVATRASTTPFILSTGNAAALDALTETTEVRGQWFGKLDQLLMRSLLRNLHADGDVTAIALFDPTVKPGSHARFSVHPETTSDFLTLFDGYGSRDYGKTFSMGLGQPHVEMNLEHLRAAIEKNAHLSQSQGAALAREALGAWYATHYQAAVIPEEIEFSHGASGAIFQLLSALPKGSTVLMQDLSFSAYANQADLLGLKTKRLPLDNGGILRLEHDPSVSLVIVNFPHNPTGKLLGPLARKHLHRLAADGTLVVNDLSYTTYQYDRDPIESLLTGATTHHNLVEIFSTSKDVGLPEARVSALVGDRTLLDKVRRFPNRHELAISGQRLGLVASALSDPALYASDQAEMKRRRDSVVRAFRHAGWPRPRIQSPEAGQNVMVTLPSSWSSEKFAQELWKRAGVMVMPAAFYGYIPPHQADFVRVSLSETSDKMFLLAAAFDRAGLIYHTDGPEFVEGLDRPFLKLAGRKGREVEVHVGASSEIEKLPHSARRGYELAIRRYVDHYGEDARRFIPESQSKIDPHRTYYFSVRNPGKEDPIAFFMLEEGQNSDGTTAPLAVEEAFPGVNLRDRPDGFRSEHVYEGIRFATAEGTTGMFGDINLGIARFMERRYGSIEHMPDDLVVYIWTIVPKVHEHYITNGWRSSLTAEQLGTPWRMLNEIRKDDVVRILKAATP